LIGLVEEAQQSKSRSQGLANRAALWLTVIALADITREESRAAGAALMALSTAAR